MEPVTQLLCPPVTLVSTAPLALAAMLEVVDHSKAEIASFDKYITHPGEHKELRLRYTRMADKLVVWSSDR